MKRYTNYLCNNIVEIDPSVYDNARFSFYEENEDGSETQTEVYQWYLTDATESDVEFLEKSFGLLFTYSNVLDMYVLCVDHYGTSWNGVPCEVLNDEINDAYLEGVK